MVVLEAMALGRAILCSQWAGASELVGDGENGYRFDPKQPEKLADLMKRFIENPELAGEMGARSQQIMDRYSPDTAAEFLSRVTSFVLEH
jgi:glycosyltransferase involved in cell wall biosynthesis